MQTRGGRIRSCKPSGGQADGRTVDQCARLFTYRRCIYRRFTYRLFTYRLFTYRRFIYCLSARLRFHFGMDDSPPIG